MALATRRLRRAGGAPARGGAHRDGADRVGADRVSRLPVAPVAPSSRRRGGRNRPRHRRMRRGRSSGFRHSRARIRTTTPPTRWRRSSAISCRFTNSPPTISPAAGCGRTDLPIAAMARSRSRLTADEATLKRQRARRLRLGARQSPACRSRARELAAAAAPRLRRAAACGPAVPRAFSLGPVPPSAHRFRALGRGLCRNRPLGLRRRGAGRRRCSATAQAARPGRPTANSRARLTRPRARAVSADSPVTPASATSEASCAPQPLGIRKAALRAARLRLSSISASAGPVGAPISHKVSHTSPACPSQLVKWSDNDQRERRAAFREQGQAPRRAAAASPPAVAARSARSTLRAPPAGGVAPASPS